MSTIACAVQGVIDRLNAVDMPIKRLSEISGVSVGTIWSLRKASSAEGLNITSSIIQRIESALDRLDSAEPTHADHPPSAPSAAA